MDFFRICTRETKDGKIEIYPDFTVGRSNDLMVRGGSFYAIWDEERNLWSTDEYDVQRLVDAALLEESQKVTAGGIRCSVRYLRSFGSNGWTQFRKFMKNVSDNSHQLDEKLSFAGDEVKKNDYVSRCLPYSLTEGDYSAWDELVGHLYSPEERAKIEWAIGAIVSGDSRRIQKFLVFYGSGGTGKGTILSIIEKLFEGYTTSFEAKALVGNNAFSTEVFKSNPLVAIQYDGDLSRIEDNSKLNSIIAHEKMTLNEKYKPSYTSRINAFLFMGTNKPVKISDAKSGLIRRLIDVRPSGKTFDPEYYNTLMTWIEFQLGAIAHHCLNVYRSMGKNYYNAYRPMEMMFQTDVFFNFVEANFDIFKSQDGVSLKQAYALYKEYCSETGIDYVLAQYKVREELRHYFTSFQERSIVDGVAVRSYYSGFSAERFKAPVAYDSNDFSLVLDETISLLDNELADRPAQEATARGIPGKYWTDEERLINGEMKRPRPDQVVKTTLSEIDTSQVHFVKVPENLIVIDFDIKDEHGNKSLERNLTAASKWPPTYGELSKSGEGVHLHYYYNGGDPGELAPNFDSGIEVKYFGGDSSLRRRLSRCNAVSIAELPVGRLPLKEKKVLSSNTIKSERGLRDLILRNLRKEVHPGTKPSIDFIAHILEEAYHSGMSYDVTDLRARIVAFANNSTNQPLQCLKVVQTMKFSSQDVTNRNESEVEKFKGTKDERLTFFDVEVYPNLFVVAWKYRGDANVVKMINPTPQEVEALFEMRLVGFNNRRYDNHILWARYMGYDNDQLYKLSMRIIEGQVSAMFGEAYNLSYTDIYDFSSVKQGLKKFQIQLGIHHMELDLPWDQPVDKKDWTRVADYCANDVISTEVVFDSREQDFVARLILSELSGLTPNDTTQKHTARIVFGDDRAPQRSFVYTDLSKEFSGYIYDRGKSTYREEIVGEGGYVYAEPGMYQDVAVLDITSMHPTSIKCLNLFGDYTPNFAALTAARIAIKRKDFSSARKALGGRLAPFLKDESQAAALSYALKIIINIVYGLTSAKFENPFRDTRNKDNIVAKRGALFMIDLKHFIREQGFEVVHIKTDSVKIPNATPEIIEQVKLFGEKYGYDFEHEVTYDQFCLVNDAVYIARHSHDNEHVWTAVGAQFQHPYVFKKLFTKEEVVFSDLCEAKSVTQGAMYLSFGVDKAMALAISDMHFVGRTGLFVPVKEGVGGGILYRVKDEKTYAVAGTKGYFWLEAEHAKLKPEEIDMTYFERLAEEARNAIDFYGPFTTFVG